MGPLVGLAAVVPQVPLLPLEKSGVGAILPCPTHRVFVGISRGSVVDVASKLTSKVAVPLGTS